MQGLPNAHTAISVKFLTLVDWVEPSAKSNAFNPRMTEKRWVSLRSTQPTRTAMSESEQDEFQRSRGFYYPWEQLMEYVAFVLSLFVLLAVFASHRVLDDRIDYFWILLERQLRMLHRQNDNGN